MSAKGIVMTVGLVAVLVGAMVAFAAAGSESRGGAGRMDEVVVAAHAPAMMLDEVVVRPVDLTGAMMPEVVVTAQGPRVVVAAPSVVPVEMN